VPTAAFTTLGCKVNQYETQRLLDDFEARGFIITEFNAPADVYVINTCSVTQAAERKSRYMLRKLTRQNPEAVVIMTGCYAEMARIKGETVSEASLIVPNHLKLDTLNHLLRAYPHMERDLAVRPPQATSAAPAHRTRATIKVQDGCDVFCSFCSIPYTRKVMRSRPVAEIVAEAERRVAQGYREIVITGVLVGAYGQEPGFAARNAAYPASTDEAELSDIPSSATPGHWSAHRVYARPDLADLLLRLAQVPGILRVRLSSIEPTQVTDRLLDAFAAEPKLCRHLHIPLQSGDSAVLHAMNRPYDQEYYLERCRAAQERIPDLAITADIMVGFPGEDRAAFENTLHVVRTVGYARAHLFRYSPRPNTPAADYTNQVSEEEKEARSQELGAACRATQEQFIRRYIGRELEVLVEGKEGQLGGEEATESASGNDNHPRVNAAPSNSVEHLNTRTPEHPNTGSKLLSGYTSNYIRVQFTGGAHLKRTEVKVHLLEPTGDGALGEVGGAHFGPQEAPPDADFIPLATFAATL
jgi:threonylcarbamoyladenosine tRNA methylthiotransferase MtaB